MIRRLFLLLFLSLFSVAIQAQLTKVRGVVTDSKTGEPVPMASVLFVGTTDGITTDFDGKYYLETREKVTELLFSYVGYDKVTIKLKYGAYNEINVKLEPSDVELEEVTVRPGENPAHPILKNVSANKYRNDPSQMPGYNCKTFTQMELDVTNINPEFKNKRLQKNFGFVFNYMDTSAITGKAFLPVMLSETSAEYYHRKNPSLSREIVKANRISGIEKDASLSQFTGHLYVNVNPYDNYINVFEVKFASPLCDHGLLFYNYFLIDSTVQQGHKIYKIRFHPKAFSVPVLDGEINIDSTTWALTSAKMKMPKGLNINWIRNLVMETDRQLISDSVWFLKKDKIFADFSINPTDSSKITSFLGHRQVDYSDVNLTDVIPKDVLQMDNDVVTENDVIVNDPAYWDTIRPYKLGQREQQIYGMVDSIKNTPLFRNIYDVINTALFGYYNFKYFGLGPYYKLYSFNKYEGNRFQLGFHTTSGFSKVVQFTGYGAYETKLKKFRYGGSALIMFNNKPTSSLTVAYKHDVLQLGAGVNAFTEGNILSSVFSTGNNERLSPVDQLDVDWNKEWGYGWSNTFGVQFRKVYTSKYVELIKPLSGEISSVNSAVLRLNTRYCKNEILVRNTFEKISLGSDYPAIELNLSTGIKGLWFGDYNFFRTELSVSHDFHIAPIGYSEFELTGGKIFGKVPYPLLKLHEGNATFFYDTYAFSCMNFYEFASDMWASLFYEHHFRGFFLSKIPLMKKLKWREVFTLKALIGSLSHKNDGSDILTSAELRFPDGMTSVNKPYIETGLGIENIFRIFRVDAIWRLTHRDSPLDINKFVVNFTFHINF